MAQPSAASRGVTEIQALWRVPLGLVPDDPADPGGQWHGPCPRCHQPRQFSAKPGDVRPVVWWVHCTCPLEQVYVILRSHVPSAPPPGKKRAEPDPAPALELAALRAAVTRLALNDDFPRSAPIRLALLEAAGYETDQALDALGITDSGNRSRTRSAKIRAMAGGKPRKRPPARTVTNDSGHAVTNDSPARRARAPRKPAACENTDLIMPATIVLGPPGNGHLTDTDTDLDLAVDLLRSTLGAEVIPATWPPAEEGPCRRCGARTCIYGDYGSPLCDACRSAEPPAVPVPLPGPRMSYHREQALAG